MNAKTKILGMILTAFLGLIVIHINDAKAQYVLFDGYQDNGYVPSVGAAPVALGFGNLGSFNGYPNVNPGYLIFSTPYQGAGTRLGFPTAAVSISGYGYGSYGAYDGNDSSEDHERSTHSGHRHKH